MAQLSTAEFEALWEGSQKAPALSQADVKPIQLDLSLSGILDQYTVTANRYLAQGKITKVDHDELILGVNALKKTLGRIKDKDLMAQEVTERAKVRVKQVQDHLAAFTAALLHPHLP
jgi:hypothetical protein